MRLVDLADVYGLVVANTLFQHKDIRTATWSGPAEKGGPGGPWPTHRSKMELQPPGVWLKLTENGIGD